MYNKHIFSPLTYGLESSFAFFGGLLIQEITGYLSFSIENLILLVIASILPNRTCIRTGTFVGMLMAPPMVNALKDNLFSKGQETYIPLALIKIFDFIFSNHKIFFGILGGIVGSIIFYLALEEYLYKRIGAHLLAGGGSALVCFLFTFVIILLLAMANKYGHPRRFLACLEILIVGGIVFPIFGAIWGLFQGILEKISRSIKKSLFNKSFLILSVLITTSLIPALNFVI